MFLGTKPRLVRRLFAFKATWLRMIIAFSGFCAGFGPTGRPAVFSMMSLLSNGRLSVVLDVRNSASVAAILGLTFDFLCKRLTTTRMFCLLDFFCATSASNKWSAFLYFGRIVKSNPVMCVNFRLHNLVAGHRFASTVWELGRPLL